MNASAGPECRRVGALFGPCGRVTHHGPLVAPPIRALRAPIRFCRCRCGSIVILESGGTVWKTRAVKLKARSNRARLRLSKEDPGPIEHALVFGALVGAG